jgi:hypothetical protein
MLSVSGTAVTDSGGSASASSANVNGMLGKRAQASSQRGVRAAGRAVDKPRCGSGGAGAAIMVGQENDCTLTGGMGAHARVHI